VVILKVFVVVVDHSRGGVCHRHVKIRI
jgi:hypothetical protein